MSLSKYYMSLHKEFRKTSYFIKQLKETYYTKFKECCPVCKSKRLHWIEGKDRFKKWFCVDCCAMSYGFTCPHCEKDVIQHLRYKNHIYKEYRIGRKWSDDDAFYRECQKEYFVDMIKLHKESKALWEQRYAVWKKRKSNAVIYGRG